MIVGQVVGRVWNAREVPSLAKRRLVMVKPAEGALVVAVDLVEVAEGNTVLVTGDDVARRLAGEGVDAAVVALVGGADHHHAQGAAVSPGAPGHPADRARE
ncbi:MULTISPECIES: EutN/CcmL family microcompartment protein [unclassified Streptomyces]|uniref:EutN/CcmL family microcompartment protein n=1 Tax=unclassified Streptomyces TaxID=2593676 RepID=UPI0022379370|nr:EutN/CcmL family microcompartment protein [Streptomyces sp. SHP 1-2]MCW5251301.1 hypothetical protein [Streptomyces sp. SHP 1-2]